MPRGFIACGAFAFFITFHTQPLKCIHLILIRNQVFFRIQKLENGGQMKKF